MGSAADRAKEQAAAAPRAKHGRPAPRSVAHPASLRACLPASPARRAQPTRPRARAAGRRAAAAARCPTRRLQGCRLPAAAPGACRSPGVRGGACSMVVNATRRRGPAVEPPPECAGASASRACRAPCAPMRGMPLGQHAAAAAGRGGPHEHPHLQLAAQVAHCVDSVAKGVDADASAGGQHLRQPVGDLEGGGGGAKGAALSSARATRHKPALRCRRLVRGPRPLATAVPACCQAHLGALPGAGAHEGPLGAQLLPCLQGLRA